MHLDAGLRIDDFRFDVNDHIVPADSGVQGAARLQPKLTLSYAPTVRLPLTFHASYGLGISSQDARGVVQRPDAPKLSTTDFYQIGASNNFRKDPPSTDIFLINRSNEQVYIPDDGSFEFKGPSRAYGWEAKTSIQFTRYLSLNSGFTQVSTPTFWERLGFTWIARPIPWRIPGSTVTEWHGLNGSLRYRHVSAYMTRRFGPHGATRHRSGRA